MKVRIKYKEKQYTYNYNIVRVSLTDAMIEMIDKHGGGRSRVINSALNNFFRPKKTT